MTSRLPLAALALLSLASCDARRSDGKITVELDTAQAKAQAKEAGREIKAGAEEAGREIKAGAQEAGRAIKAAKQEFDIGAALEMDATIDRNAIAVAADEPRRTIRLTGTVLSVDQRMRVEAIAREKAEGWTIVNEVRVVATPASAPAGAVTFTLPGTAPSPARASAP